MPAHTITFHVGGCGVHVGSTFWQCLADDRAAATAAGVDVNEATHFDEMPDGRLVPRAVIADFESGVIDHVRRSIGAATGMNPDHQLALGGSCGANWCRGYDDNGVGVEQVLDRIRISAEGCDALGQFHITRSLHGGAGSGFGGRVSRNIQEEYPAAFQLNTVVLPAAEPCRSGNSVLVGAYNSVLGLNTLIEHSSASLLYHNSAIAAHADATSAEEGSDGFAEANAVIARNMVAVEGLGRYERASSQSQSVRGMVQNMAPYSRLKFLSMAQTDVADSADFGAAGERLLQRERSSLVTDATSMQNHDCGLNDKKEKSDPLASSGVFSVSVVSHAAVGGFGTFSDSSALSAGVMRGWAARGTVREYPIPTLGMHRGPVTAATGRPAASPHHATATAAILDPAVGAVVRRMLGQFKCLFQRKAFLHHFTDSGMDEMELTEAQESVRHLVNEFEWAAEPNGGDSEFEDDDPY